MDTLRAFIAIEIPGFVADAVRRSQQALQRDGIRLRWVRPENVHLTLRFLGDISAATIPAIREAMERSVFRRQPVSLRISGIGVFPGLKRPKVMWLGLQGQVHLLDDLHLNLSSLLAEQGIPLEKRPFKGHLTIGRVKERLDSEDLGTALLRPVLFKTDDFVADSICLFKSDLTTGGAVYTPLVRTTIKR
jgi:RNA 2',3'-cyclic 3'-phosphodiesterase